eukprot:986519-Lingulodinium_polyedra.AAC.1
MPVLHGHSQCLSEHTAVDCLLAAACVLWPGRPCLGGEVGACLEGSLSVALFSPPSSVRHSSGPVPQT